MPFGLKNAGATYQKVMDRAFEDQIGRNIEAYVDDIIVKRNAEQDLIQDITEVFAQLQKYNLWLNLKNACSAYKTTSF